MIHISWQLIFALLGIYAVADEDADTVKNLNTIFLRFYNGATLNEYVDYLLNDVSVLQANLIDDRPTMLYLHGYTEHVERESVQTIVQAYLKRNDHNIIAVNYKKLVNGTYMEARENMVYFGAVLASVLDNMVELGHDPEKLHIVSHSLGSQLAAHVGRKVKRFQIPRITGLDPAGPFYNIVQKTLSSNDARFVDIIHTDYGLIGVGRTTGTVDFFPNNGRNPQPGCPDSSSRLLINRDLCSHHRSWRFYAESLTNESSFLGVQCSSWAHFLSGSCNDHERITMGYGVSTSAKGNVYLITAAQKPFGLQEQGIQLATTYNNAWDEENIEYDETEDI